MLRFSEYSIDKLRGYILDDSLMLKHDITHVSDEMTWHAQVDYLVVSKPGLVLALNTNPLVLTQPMNRWKQTRHTTASPSSTRNEPLKILAAQYRHGVFRLEALKKNRKNLSGSAKTRQLRCILQIDL